MRDTSRERPVPPGAPFSGVLAIAALGPLFGAGYALFLGQDVNGDQRNYHFESAFSFLAGRLDVDAAPSGLVHSFFNPLPYLPFYTMTRLFPPRLEIALTGAWQGVSFALAFALGLLLTRGQPPRIRLALAALAALVSAAAPMALSELGSSMADLTLAPLILAATVALVAGAEEERTGPALALIGLAAFGIGLAIGLKLTNGIYALGIAAACGLGLRSWGKRALSFAVAGGAGALGVALSGGFWFLALWRKFQSPLFPYFDRWFVSPAIDPASPLHGESFFDAHFRYRDLGDVLSLPFRWIVANQTTAELPFRDMRFAILALALVAGALALALKRKSLDAAGAQLIAFVVASFAAWAYEFPIQRYIVGLELLLGPALLVAFSTFLTARVGMTALAATALVSALSVKSPDWGHVKPGRDWYGLKLPESLQTPALVFTEAYTSFVGPFLPPKSIVVGLAGGVFLRAGSGTFSDRTVAAALEREPPLPIFVLTSTLFHEPVRKALGSYGLTFSGPCLPVPNTAAFLAACPLSRGAPVARAALTLRAGDTLDFGPTAGGLAALFAGWNADSGWGWVGADYQPKLLLSVDASLADAPVKLTFKVSGLDEFGADDALTFVAGDRTLALWSKETFPADHALVVCIPADLFSPTQPTLFAFGYRRLGPGGGDARASMGLTSLRAERGGCEPQTPHPESPK